MEPQHERLSIDGEPRRLLVTSEPYIIFNGWQYQPVVNVFEKKSKKNYYIYISSKSLSRSLEVLRGENNGRMTGLEFWIHKESSDKKSKFILTE